MIRFIDITTGNVFNGSQPYVFWFDKGQSVNLNYVRKICILTTDSTLNVSIPNNPVFCLLDTTKMGDDIELSGKKFKDLDSSGFKTYEYISTGAQYNNFYVHMLYVLGRSADAGEFREDLIVGDETFKIGADFYNEREELSINLLNQGLEMPKLVEKAIYEFNIHEDGVDNILLNRKYKELLGEYMNILGNKGSYKSIINSVEWFEYGDLLRALDYWRHAEPTRSILSSHELSQIVDKGIEDIMTKSHKTTYLGLYLALTRVSLDAEGNIVYRDGVKYWDDEVDKQYGESWESATTQKLLTDSSETIITDPKDRLLQIGEDQIRVSDYSSSSAQTLPFTLPYTIGEGSWSPSGSLQGSNWRLLDRYFDEHGNVVCREIPEPVPDIDFAASKWDAIDLSLKMTMLGNFFSTYFMPLHLDLIHSTIENIVFTNTIKIFSWPLFHRQDWNHDIESFSCDAGEKDYYMSDVKARVYPDTTFGEQYEEGVMKLNVFGVDLEDREYVFDEDGVKTFLGQRFEGPGVIIPFHCILHHVQQGMYITEASIMASHGDVDRLYHTYNIKNKPEEISVFDGDRHIDFNILLRDIGDYQLTVDFKCGNGMHYIKTFKFAVYDDINQDVKMYKIIRRDWEDIKNILPKEKDDLIKFMFTQLDDNDSIYRQFLATSDYAFQNKLGLNQIIIYEPQVTETDGEVELTYNIKIGDNTLATSGSHDDIISEVEDFVQTLNYNPKYRFFIQERLGLRVENILNYPWAEDIDLDCVIKYKNSKNIAYLYDIIRRNEHSLTGSDSGSGDIDSLYTIIPYIFGICLQFDSKPDVTLASNLSTGIIKDGHKTLTYYDVTMNMNTWRLDVPTRCPIKNETVNAYVKTVKTVRTRTDRALKYTEEWTPISDPGIYTYIIDNTISLKFEWVKSEVTKEVIIPVPEIMGFNSEKKAMNINGTRHTCVVPYTGETMNQYIIPDSDIDNNRIGRLYLRHNFIPVFHHKIEVPSRKIVNNDVICFLPDLSKTRNSKYHFLGWTFTNATTHDEIQPLPYKRKDLYWDRTEKPYVKDDLVDPLEPILGRYDLKKIIDPGYYDVQIDYELITDHDSTHRYRSESEFIVEK